MGAIRSSWATLESNQVPPNLLIRRSTSDLVTPPTPGSEPGYPFRDRARLSPVARFVEDHRHDPTGARARGRWALVGTVARIRCRYRASGEREAARSFPLAHFSPTARSGLTGTRTRIFRKPWYHVGLPDVLPLNDQS